MVKYVDWKTLFDYEEIMTLWSYWWFCWQWIIL